MKCNAYLKLIVVSFAVFSLAACGTAPSAQVGLQEETVELSSEAETIGTDGDFTVSEDSATAFEAGESVYVHICGAVAAPGVYALEPGSRLYEAVEAAGGFLPDACEEYCNLALTVTDGMQYQIPTREEAASGELPVQMGFGSQPGESTGQQSYAESAYNKDGLLNINLATAEELMTLPGIGQTRADAIISYREENGAFARKEDIMLVSGIKEASYQKIENYITVER